MSDRRTQSVLARRQRGKTLLAGTVGAALGFALKVLFGIQPIESFFDWFQIAGELFPGARLWLQAHPGVTGWIAGPIMLGLLAAGLASLPAVRSVLDRLLPGPPPFVRSALDEARRRDRVISLEGPPLPFVGRENAVAELEALLTLGGGGPFAWRVLTGASGIGKTRLGIEWLEAARAKAWDVGIVDPDDLALARRWRARRPTALLVDEARSDWDARLGELLVALAAGAASRAPVRVLVVDQVQPFVDIQSGDDRATVRAAVTGAPLRLKPLDDAEVRGLCAASARVAVDEERVVRESGGVPRAALILINAPDAATYADALIEWVERLEPAIGDEARPLPLPMAGPLFLAALAGPIDADVARELCGDVDSAALARFFPESEAAGLERRLPALVPDDLATALLLRLLSRFDLRRREAMVDRLLRDAPEAVERRLGSIWRTRPELDAPETAEGPAASLRWLQHRFDHTRLDWVAKAHERVEAAALLIQETGRPGLPEALGHLAALSDSRRFDAEVRALEARGLAVALREFEAAGDAQELERWIARLVAAGERFPDHVGIGNMEAAGIESAIACYAVAGQAEAVERWGDRLRDLCDREPFRSNAEIRRSESRACGEAMAGYGASHAFDRLESWGERLAALVADDRLAGNLEIRRDEATAVTHACAAYGRTRNLAEQERWAARLTAMIADLRFAGDPRIRLEEGNVAANAITAYAGIGDWEGLERWALRLIRLSEDERLAAEPDIVRAVAVGVLNAVVQYGFARRFESLERWGERLSAMTRDSRANATPATWEAEAIAAVNAMAAYGQEGEFEQLERWGRRLVAAVSEPRFGGTGKMPALECMGAYGALTIYGAAKELEPIERWGGRIVALADDPRFADDADIRGYEAQAAYNALAAYGGRAQYRGVSERWRRRLARVALEFPFEMTIQQAAELVDLHAAGQRRKDYPYGRPRQRVPSRRAAGDRFGIAYEEARVTVR